MTEKMKDDLAKGGFALELSNMEEIIHPFEQAATDICRYVDGFHFPAETQWTTLKEIKDNKERPMWPGLNLDEYANMLDSSGALPTDASKSEFPGNKDQPLAGQASYVRLCQEFIF